jgi:uncharacterized protein (DUF58 family)
MERVYSKVKNLHLLSKKLVDGFFAGNYRSVFKGTGIEFDEVREYVEGDDTRLIDWNVTGRMGSPYAKSFREERELVLNLLIDVSPSMLSGGAEYSKADVASITAAALSYAALYNEDQVGGIFFSDKIERYVPPRKGKVHVNSLIQDMISHKTKGNGSNLAMGIRTMYETMTRRGICIIISDFKMDQGWRELSILARKHDVIAVRIYDPSDKQFPDTGMIELQDPETGKRILASRRNKKFVKGFQDFWDASRVYWSRECNRRGVDTCTIALDEDPAFALIKYFARKRRKH